MVLFVDNLEPFGVSLLFAESSWLVESHSLRVIDDCVRCFFASEWPTTGVRKLSPKMETMQRAAEWIITTRIKVAGWRFQLVVLSLIT